MGVKHEAKQLNNVDKSNFNGLYIQGGNSRYEIINYLKGFSIFTIVLMHLIQNQITNAPGIIKTASSIGGTGVHVFLFCSGFGLYYSYLNRKQSFGEFIKRRFTKIYIPYIIVVLISAAIPFMYHGKDRGIAVLSHIFLFKMFMPQYEESFGTQFWYISTIIQFYLIFIPLCKIKNKFSSNKAFFGMALAISVAWWIFVSMMGLESERIWNSFFLQYIWEFVLGMCIADHLHKKRDVELKLSVLVPAALVGLGLTFIAARLGGAWKVFNDIPALLGYAALALIIYLLDKKDFIKKLVIKINAFSYEWFLLHILVFTCIFRLKADSLVMQCLLGVIAFAFSIVTAKVMVMVEKRIRLHR